MMKVKPFPQYEFKETYFFAEKDNKHLSLLESEMKELNQDIKKIDRTLDKLRKI